LVARVEDSPIFEIQPRKPHCLVVVAAPVKSRTSTAKSPIEDCCRLPQTSEIRNWKRHDGLAVRDLSETEPAFLDNHEALRNSPGFVLHAGKRDIILFDTAFQTIVRAVRFIVQLFILGGRALPFRSQFGEREGFDAKRSNFGEKACRWSGRILHSQHNSSWSSRG
jgi:hypothetical protein